MLLRGGGGGYLVSAHAGCSTVGSASLERLDLVLQVFSHSVLRRARAPLLTTPAVRNLPLLGRRSSEGALASVFSPACVEARSWVPRGRGWCHYLRW
ncbi:hypothetical protein NDU88_002062 [Pleurodeles waltl]|uniref:Secreted protein n=1 Tax=Pleurodeles waltl TaxID=8319 RepID=A0AAV7MM93_PLEWA|nr:hypothetical protein NDU88_002062 [Pleurodeles waltl]